MFTLTCPAHNNGARHPGRDGRSPLLLAAALAVAVPGFLVTACSGQVGSGAAGSDAIAAANRPATGVPATEGRAPSTSRRPSAVRAVQLLAQAAQAAVVTSYQGEEVVTRWSSGSGSVLVSDIWHVSGGQTVTQTLDAGASFSSQPYLSSDTDGQAPEGVLGVTAPLVQLLETHYVVAYAGAGSADNRAAQVVEAWRADGSLAARFWLDDATRLPLEREVFDSAAHVIGRDVFLNVQFANQGASGPAPASAGGAAASHDPQGSWTDPLSQAQLLALRTRGWLVPEEIPGGLSLFTGAETEFEHRYRARPGLLGRPVDGLGLRATRPPGGQAGRLAENHGGRPRDLRGGAGSALPDLVQPRHGVHVDGGRADPDRRRGGRRAAA